MPVPAHNFLGSFSPSPEPNLELKNFFAQDDQGNKLPGAICYLYQRGTESQATGLQKANGVAMLNPMSADSNGLIQLAAPNGLYDLRVISGERDFRIHLQFNDVSEDLAAANVAAERAEMARDAAQLSAGIFSTTAEGLSSTTNGKYFSVVSATSTEYLILYRNTGGVAIEIDRYPNATAVSGITKMVQAVTSPAAEPEHMTINDGEDTRLATLTSKRLETIPFDIISDSKTTVVGDSEGAAILYADENGVVVGEMEMQRTDQPGIFITDKEGALFAVDTVKPEADELLSPFYGGLLFSPVIVTSTLHDSRIYTQGILRRRSQASDVVLSVSSNTTSANETGASVAISASRFGPDAVLNVRLKSDPNSRKFLPLSLKNVPVQATPRSPKILFIGDSIGDRQGGQFLQQFLQELGFTPQFIGTIEGSASVTDVWDINGPLGECHAGWKTGDFTYSVNDRAMIVSPGGEPAYRALTKAARRERNGFLRAATGADDASIVRNGYVFDPAFYQSRFNLDTPDIVINSLGVNDALNTSMEDIYTEVYANDLLINKQLKSAWPNAKIIRTLPTSALNGDANNAWVTRHAQVIKALIAAAAASANNNITVAPLWAMTNSEVSYAFSQATAGTDGFFSGNWLDSVHPTGSGRQELYQSLAPYVAAADLNLI